jgi:ring-1,2-phenylacetyl-CoA epoxidase subunit PaaD
MIVSSDRTPAEQRVWEVMEEIADPEIPVLSLVEMKVIRDVKVDDQVTVVFSPTYVGCPATAAIMQEIRTRLREAGFGEVRIETTFSPPWSTDLLDESTREKLRAFGIAAPPHNARDLAAALMEPVPCPSCSSTETRLESSFGSTLCRQIFYCTHCRQSFERFKPL